MTRKLILIRHSLPEIIPGMPANRWPLSDEGKRRCALLAERLRPWRPDRVVSSVEPKAAETGRLVAERLGLTFKTAEGLHEHERSRAAFSDRDTFQMHIAALFAHPDEYVFGDESAAQAFARFSRAVDAVLDAHPTETIAMVTHGTVMTAFVAHAARLEPFSFWKGLSMPALTVLELPGPRLLHTEQIGG